MDIRPVCSEDAEAIAKLAGQLGYSIDADELGLRLADLDGLLVAAIDGQVCGWIQFLSNDARVLGDDRWEIVAMIVDETMRRRGIGRALIEAAVDTARQGGARGLRVRTRVERESALAFYEAQGFTFCKTQRVFDRKLRG